MGRTPPLMDTGITQRVQTVPGDPMGVRHYTLRNGLQVFLTVNKQTPRIQTMIAVRAGSKNDPSDNTGLAHYLEHMLFKGTHDYGTLNDRAEQRYLSEIENLFEIYRKTSDTLQRSRIYHSIDSLSLIASQYAIANEYDKLMSHIGAEGTNAFTWFDQTVYINDIPSNQADAWLTIESNRFKNPVFRLFHTELEAVYEEKNRSLDNDDDKLWDALFYRLFPQHTYGSQTTIGTVEHLKNPSLKAIREFYKSYYLPNNMAIILSGDFNADELIKKIEAAFSGFQSGNIPKRTVNSPFTPTEGPISVWGPNPESLIIGYRYPAAGSYESDVALLCSLILNNGTAGLLDLHVNQAQKAINANAINFNLNEFSFFGVSANPKNQQSLPELESLLRNEIKKLQDGTFPDWLVQAAITDIKLKKTKELEQNSSRAYAVLNAFINGISWSYQNDWLNRIQKITKQDIQQFAKTYLNDRVSVVVYKRLGTDTTQQRVKKPTITPVSVNRDAESDFVKKIKSQSLPELTPVFIDYSKDLSSGLLMPGRTYLYKRNEENELFECYIRLQLGSQQNKLLPVAIQYIPFLGSSEKSPQTVKELLYRMGCQLSVFNDAEKTWIQLSGLHESFEPALKIVAEILQKPKVLESKLQSLISDVLKTRENAKMDKRILLNKALYNYVVYGPENPFTCQLSNEALKLTTTSQIESLIASLLQYQHEILYYGPGGEDAFKKSINACLPVKQSLKKCPEFKPWIQRDLQNKIFAAEFDMTQAEALFVSKGSAFSPTLLPASSLYNTYFGGGMSSLVFQELRESKALAYATYARHSTPNKPYYHFVNMAYIGTQADKLELALSGMTQLLDSLPYSKFSFENSKSSAIQEIQAQRVLRSDVLFNALQAREMLHTADPRQIIYQALPALQFSDLLQFHRQEVKTKPRSLLLIGKKEFLKESVLKPYGTLEFIDLKTLYGY